MPVTENWINASVRAFPSNAMQIADRREEQIGNQREQFRHYHYQDELSRDTRCEGSRSKVTFDRLALLASRFSRNNRSGLNTATRQTSRYRSFQFSRLRFPSEAARCTSQKLHERLARSRDAITSGAYGLSAKATTRINVTRHDGLFQMRLRFSKAPARYFARIVKLHSEFLVTGNIIRALLSRHSMDEFRARALGKVNVTGNVLRKRRMTLKSRRTENELLFRAIFPFLFFYTCAAVPLLEKVLGRALNTASTRRGAKRRDDHEVSRQFSSRT